MGKWKARKEKKNYQIITNSWISRKSTFSFLSCFLLWIPKRIFVSVGETSHVYLPEKPILFIRSDKQNDDDSF
jgi:hypothetical protein